MSCLNYRKVLTFHFLIAVFVCSLTVHAQVPKRQLLDMEHEAQELFHQGLFYKALPMFLKLDSLEPKSKHYKYPIGVCYLNTYDAVKALPYFEACLDSKEKHPPRLLYYIAKCYHLNHYLDSAIVYYEQYKTSLGTKTRNQQYVKMVDKELNSCKIGKEMMANPMKIEVHNLGPGINTHYPEYGAVISADEDELIFTSNRPNSIGGEIDEADGRYYEDIYISSKVNGEWSAPVQMSSEINTDGHDASIALTPDGQKLILYRYNKDNIMSLSTGALYVSHLDGVKWTSPQKFPPQINEGAYQPSACLSENEKIMFFASNREGGLGGTDLYMVRKLPTGEWALPMNMGSVVNTPYDEDSPFLHPDGKTLYFSSSGHKTMGGYDIFMTSYNDSTKTWSEPQNVGYPISTAQDDIHFSWSADARRVYFSSIRAGGYGDKDIYYADIEKRAAEVLVLKGLVVDSLTQQPIEATIKVIDVNTNEIVGVFSSNSATGKYLVILPEGKNYQFSVEASDYDVCSQNFDVEELHEYKVLDKNISLCPAKK